MKSSIPAIPIRLPPTVTATRTQIDGSPTELPTNVGVNQVAFNLLQYKEHDDKPQGPHRVDNQDKECADDAADKSADQRDQRGQCDERPTMTA